MRIGLSVEERTYYQEKIISAAESLKDKTNQMINSQTLLKEDDLMNVSLIFSELAELTEDLSVPLFSTYFKNFSDVTQLCSQVENIRAHKKVTSMIHDGAELLSVMGASIENPDRLKGVLRGFEVLSHKQERMRRGEFYTVCRRAS